MNMVRLVFGIFAVVGMGLLIGGAFAFQHTRRFLATAITAQGVVKENVPHQEHDKNNNIKWVYYPRISFRTSDGQELSFMSDAGSNPPSYRVNDRVAVVYDPHQPEHADVNSFMALWFLPTLLGGMGVLFCSFGVVAAALKFATARKNAWLEQNGRRIQAEFTGVELNTSVRVNGSSPYRLVCQWLDPSTNRMHVFHSANIWYDPSQYISGKTLDVLLDPENPGRYKVETSFLPKLA